MKDEVRQRFDTGDFNNGVRRKFELTASLAKNSSAQAKWLRWDVKQAKLITDGVSVTVQDDLGRYAGISGERGEAEWDGRAKRWRVVEMYRRALWIEFTLNSDLTTGSALVTVTACHEGLDFTDNALSVLNPEGFTGSSGNPGKALRKDDGSYSMVQLRC